MIKSTSHVNKSLAMCLAWLLFCVPMVAQATETPESHELYGVTGTAVLLQERSTGRILYARNPDMPIYPASMIKVLTAIVLLDHVGLDDVVMVGNEIHHVPAGSSIVQHAFGEQVTGQNLLYGLLLPSGNDTANVVAAHVARLVHGAPLPFEEAETLFVQLMNERASAIGLTDSHFTNAHGFHDPQMQVTARDLARLADYALNIPVIRQVAGTLNYTGYTVPPTTANWETMQTRPISWNNTNRLLAGALHNPEVTGLKTGFHTPAGHTFLGSGQRDGIELITVIGGSYAETRFVDTTRLLNYGFSHYAFRQVHGGGEHLADITLVNPRWGDEAVIPVYSTVDFSYFLSEAELARVQHQITFLEALLYEPEHDTLEEATAREQLFVAPLAIGQPVGVISYTLDGVLLFQDDLIVTQEVLAWSYTESFWFLVNYVQTYPLSIFSLSLILGLIFLGIMVTWMVSLSRQLRRKSKRRKKMHHTRYKL